MTAKDKVIGVYPDAYAFRYPQPKEFWIIQQDPNDLLMWFGTGYTQEEAWEDAWNLISTTMMARLES